MTYISGMERQSFIIHSHIKRKLMRSDLLINDVDDWILQRSLFNAVLIEWGPTGSPHTLNSTLTRADSILSQA
jgi:hypothetical protein